jgi:hypothetical protein
MNDPTVWVLMCALRIILLVSAADAWNNGLHHMAAIPVAVALILGDIGSAECGSKK